VDRLAALHPDAIETTELRARVLKAGGEPSQAVDLLQQYARKPGALLDLAAALLEDLGQPAEAEAMYRRYVAATKAPEAPLALARFLARRKRLPEALSLCEPAWQTCRPESVASAIVYALRVGQGGEDQYQRAERGLVAALAQNPKALMLQVALAELQDNRGRHTEAITLYRRILQADGRNVVALNNLAYLIALTEGRPGEALELISAALELAGPHPEMLDTRAMVYLKGDQADLAVQDLQQAIALAPSALKYAHLAMAHQASRNRLAAAEALLKAKDLGLTESELHPAERKRFQQFTEAMAIE
jgi:tetratricopeptide (TPR) repeat protein